MKHFLLSVLALAAVAQATFAGSFGPGPWSNGAYYQGQFDGTYTATVYAEPEVLPGGIYSGAVISGVVGFRLQGGAPSSDGATPPAIDTLRNYYAIFANGTTFTGLTYANININDKSVAGTFSTDFYDNGIIPGDPGAWRANFYGGSFNADIDSDNAMFTFSGDGILSADIYPMAGQPVGSSAVQFGISGIKVAN